MQFFSALERADSELAYYSKRMSDINLAGTVRYIIGSDWPELGKKLKLGFTPRDVNDYFLKVFLQTIEDREKNPIQRNDFVNLLLQFKNQYTKEELAAEAFVVFFGGFETSSSLMSFILYELALNQDIQNRLREEIVTAYNENDGKLTYDMLFGLKYLEMVVSEGLRKYPSVPCATRQCNKEYTIPGTKLVIPEGVSILLNIYSILRDPEYFPDPDKFDPERFNEENIKNIKPFTNIPFGKGPRYCSGRRFGVMQSKMVITKLIKNFVIQPSEKTQIPLKLNLHCPLMAPEKGIWLRLTKVQ
jgi:cytochrome P450 family 6